MPISKYQVYRNGVLVSSPLASPYVDTGLTNGQSYSYQVSAVSEVGEGPKSNIVTVTPTGGTGISYTDYIIPGSIDHTGATDVRAAISSWIASNVPDGANTTHHSRIKPFDSSSVYLISSYDTNGNVTGFGMNNRHHITLDGGGSWTSFPAISGDAAGSAAYAAFNPATAWSEGAKIIQRSPDGSGVQKALFFIKDSTDIRVTGWTLDGENPNIGTISQWGGFEWSAMMTVFQGSADIAFDNNYGDRWRGFSWIADTDSGNTAWPNRLTVHHNFIRGGEMGIGFVACTNVEVHHNIIKDSSYHAFDIEPYDNGDTNTDIWIHHNAIDTYSWASAYSNWFFQIVSPHGLPNITERITVEDNYIKRGPGDPLQNGNYDGQGGFSVRVNDVLAPTSDIIIRRNWSDDDQAMLTGGGRYSVRVDYCHNLELSNNRQILGSTAAFYDLTSTHNSGIIITTPNITT